jgi:hypothetical protein
MTVQTYDHSKWPEGFRQALLAFVKRYDPTAVEVIEYNEDQRRVGKCDTCGYDEYFVKIDYIRQDGEYATHEYKDKFVNLLMALLEEAPQHPLT